MRSGTRADECPPLRPQKDVYSVRDVNTPELAPYPCLSDPSGRLSGHFPAAACRRDLSDTPQLAAAEISFTERPARFYAGQD